MFWIFKKKKEPVKVLESPPTTTFKARIPKSKPEAHQMLERARGRIARLEHKERKWLDSGRDKEHPQPFADLQAALKEYRKQINACYDVLGDR